MVKYQLNNVRFSVSISNNGWTAKGHDGSRWFGKERNLSDQKKKLSELMELSRDYKLES